MMKRLAILCLIALPVLAGCAASGDVVRAELPRRDTAAARRLNDRAFTLIREGREDDALPLVERALAEDDRFGPALNNLGLIRLEASQLDAAAVAFSRAADAMPGVAEPHSNLGLVFERAGQFDKAVEAYATAVEIEPGEVTFLANLCRARVRRDSADRGEREQTRRLLEELVLRAEDEDWREWARRVLLRYAG